MATSLLGDNHVPLRSGKAYGEQVHRLVTGVQHELVEAGVGEGDAREQGEVLQQLLVLFGEHPGSLVDHL